MNREYIYYKIRENAPKSLLLLVEVLQYWWRLLKYNASFHTDKDMEKMQYTLMRENHVIEKGMSMKNTRHGFGQQKVRALLQRLSKYNDLYGKLNPSFLVYPLSTIKAYLNYQEQDGVDVTELKTMFMALCTRASIDPSSLLTPAGIKLEKAEDIRDAASGDFKSLLFSRHSIRYFTGELPSKDILDKALQLAARTPSACNRQTWHTHIYLGEKCHHLLKMQGGCNGFYNDVHCAIVVTANMKGFLHYEPFQCYVDGGLYAMNLINALHYMGLGTIPLSCGFYHNKLSMIHQTFGIPCNEALVLVIGTGYLTDEVKIAESTRKDVEQTNVYHV